MLAQGRGLIHGCLAARACSAAARTSPSPQNTAFAATPGRCCLCLVSPAFARRSFCTVTPDSLILASTMFVRCALFWHVSVKRWCAVFVCPCTGANLRIPTVIIIFELALFSPTRTSPKEGHSRLALNGGKRWISRTGNAHVFKMQLTLFVRNQRLSRHVFVSCPVCVPPLMCHHVSHLLRYLNRVRLCANSSVRCQSVAGICIGLRAVRSIRRWRRGPIRRCMRRSWWGGRHCRHRRWPRRPCAGASRGTRRGWRSWTLPLAAP